MANKRRRTRNKILRKPWTWASVLTGAVLTLAGLFSQLTPMSSSAVRILNHPSSPSDQTVNSALKVHFIDVGQADSILIQSGSEAMLIDAGNNADAKLVTDYLTEQGVTWLKYVIGTHAHEDHIGSLDAVLYSFPVETVMLPNRTLETQSYNDVIKAIDVTRTPLIHPECGQIYSLAEDQFVILGPVGEDHAEVNNSSIVLRYTHGLTSILFTGDMQSAEEREILNSYGTLQSDVMKAPHHGSDTSSTVGMLEAVNPKDIIISVGRNNEYNLPSQDILDRYQRLGYTVYRTDELGTIILESDGNNYMIHN